jgi:hypothetical protein
MVKGTLLVHLGKFAVREFGQKAWDKVVDGLREGDREALRGVVLVGVWQPVGVWNRALQAFLVENYAKPETGMRELASFVADQDLNTLFRLVLKVGSPDFVLGRTPSLYNRYFQEGRFEPSKVEARHWTASLTVSADEDVGPGVFSCDAGICAWLAQALQLSGVYPRVTHPRCRFREAPSCEYDLVW